MFTLVSGAFGGVYTQAKARMLANVDKTWHFLFIIKSESILMNLIALSNLINYMAKEIQKKEHCGSGIERHTAMSSKEEEKKI